MAIKNTPGLRSSTSLGNNASSGVRRDSLSSGAKLPTPIKFGKPSSLKSLTSSNSSQGINWAGIAKGITSGSLTSLLKTNGTAGSLLKSLGFGPLVSGIVSLFSGQKKSPPPPLKLFALPESISQTVTVRNAASRSNGTYVQVSATGTTAAATPVRSSEIAQAVKTAILNSHSLKDVISEL